MLASAASGAADGSGGEPNTARSGVDEPSLAQLLLSARPSSSGGLGGASTRRPRSPMPMPPAPSPIRLEGYLRKLKSDESAAGGGGGGFGALFGRSKFNKRWFAVEARDMSSLEMPTSLRRALDSCGPLFELKYWKSSADAGRTLPSFSLDLSALLGVGPGVGKGSTSTKLKEPHVFHVETAARTYVLAAPSDKEMRWWLQGLAWYAWQHGETVRKLEELEVETARGGGQAQSSARSINEDASARAAAAAAAPASSGRAPQDLASPASSHSGSAVASGAASPTQSPLPPFSPLARAAELGLASPTGAGAAGDGVQVSLHPFGSGPDDLSASFGSAAAALTSAREAARAAQADEIEEDIFEDDQPSREDSLRRDPESSSALEHKYDDSLDAMPSSSSSARQQHHPTDSDAATGAKQPPQLPARSAVVQQLIDQKRAAAQQQQPSLYPSLGGGDSGGAGRVSELSAPIRFGNPDVETARPLYSDRSGAALSAREQQTNRNATATARRMPLTTDDEDEDPFSSARSSDALAHAPSAPPHSGREGAGSSFDHSALAPPASITSPPPATNPHARRPPVMVATTAPSAPAANREGEHDQPAGGTTSDEHDDPFAHHDNDDDSTTAATTAAHDDSNEDAVDAYGTGERDFRVVTSAISPSPPTSANLSASPPAVRLGKGEASATPPAAAGGALLPHSVISPGVGDVHEVGESGDEDDEEKDVEDPFHAHNTPKAAAASARSHADETGYDDSDAVEEQDAHGGTGDFSVREEGYDDTEEDDDAANDATAAAEADEERAIQASLQQHQPQVRGGEATHGPLSPPLLLGGDDDDPQDAQSLDAEEESIMNGSVMLAEHSVVIGVGTNGGTTGAEGAPSSSYSGRRAATAGAAPAGGRHHPDVPTLRPPPSKVLPPLVNPSSSASAAAAVQQPLPSLPPLQPTASPPASVVAAAGVSAPAVAATTAGAVLAAKSGGFTPSNSSSCNTAAHFRALRTELREYGVSRMQADQVAAGWFERVDDDDEANKGELRIATGLKPFNPFARIVSGQMTVPYGNHLQRLSMVGADAKFFVAQNRPEFDEHWASAEPEWIGKASMAQRHQFLLLRSLCWSTFNVSTFGMDASGAGGRLSDLQSAVQLLREMDAAAREYTKRMGWGPRLGLFFHAFPFNSVHALHLHMVDMDVRGPTFDVLNYKNLPLDAVLEVLEEEIKQQLTPRPLAQQVITTSSARAVNGASPSSAISAPTDETTKAAATTVTAAGGPVQVRLVFDFPYSSVAGQHHGPRHDQTWSAALLDELVAALRDDHHGGGGGVDATRLQIISVKAGSIIVTLNVLPPPSSSSSVSNAVPTPPLAASAIVAKLRAQVHDATSPLRQGLIGKKVRTLEVVPTAAVEPVASAAKGVSESSSPVATPARAAVVVAPAAASVPATAAASSSFEPSERAHCNTEADFALLRAELRRYGLERVMKDQEDKGWFERDVHTGQLRIATGVKPFNPFARIVSGQMTVPYGNHLQRLGMQAEDEKFFVAQNRPEFDEHWASAEPEWLGKASMAQHHQFLLLRSLHWGTFNVSTFGMDASGIGGRLSDLRSAVQLLREMDATAREYTRRMGWGRRLGLFFHAFPFNSVHALHLHMVDMDVRGPTFDVLNHKNLPLDAVLAVLLREIRQLDASSSKLIPAPTVAPVASTDRDVEGRRRPSLAPPVTGASVTSSSSALAPAVSYVPPSSGMPRTRFASQAGSAQVQLFFAVNVASVFSNEPPQSLAQARASWPTRMVEELCDALTLSSSSRLQVVSVGAAAMSVAPHGAAGAEEEQEEKAQQQGTMVTLDILPPQRSSSAGEPSVDQVLAALREQVRDQGSWLRRGRIGRDLRRVVVAGSDDDDVYSSSHDQHARAHPHPHRRDSLAPPTAAAAALPASRRNSWQLDQAREQHGGVLGATATAVSDIMSGTFLQPGRPAGERTPQVSAPQRLAQRAPPQAAAAAHSSSALSSSSSLSEQQVLCTCDQCYTSITSSPSSLRAAHYCWTCQLVLCGACHQKKHHNAHEAYSSMSQMPHQEELLSHFLASQADAYCPAHAIPAPLLAAPAGGGGFTVTNAAGVEVVLRHGVRARALRFTGLYTHHCSLCAKLLCAQCRAEDGLHHASSLNAHPVASLPTAFAAHAERLSALLRQHVLPRRAQLAGELAALGPLRSAGAQELQALQAETVRAREDALVALRARAAQARTDVAAAVATTTAMAVGDQEQARVINEAETVLQRFGRHAHSSAHASASTTTADLCAFLARAPSLLESVNAVTGVPAADHHRAGSSSSSAASSAAATLATRLRADASSLLSERRDAQEQVAALPSLRAALGEKDRSLAAVLASRSALGSSSAAQAQSLAALYARAHEEIGQWMSLTEQVGRKLESMKQTCAQCGLALSAAAANAPCAAAPRHNGQPPLHAFVPSVLART